MPATHRSPVKLHRRPLENADPWPDGLWPLVTRGMDGEGEWLHGSMVTVRPAAGVWYDDRLPVTSEPRVLDRWDTKVCLLVPPGVYEVEFEHPDVTVVNQVEVVDPLAGLAEIEFRDGKPMWMRGGSWDDFIIKESPYGRLEIREGDAVMDAGAHIGTFTRDVLAKGAASVIAYEPEPMNARLLRRNVEGMPVTVAEGALVGEAPGSVLLYVDGKELGRNALNSVARVRDGRLPIRVPAWNFRDELWRVKPDVVKVDVEEAQWEYSWEMPESVRELAVELEHPGREGTGDKIARICACLEAQGFVAKREPGKKGWATMGVWSR